MEYFSILDYWGCADEVVVDISNINYDDHLNFDLVTSLVNLIIRVRADSALVSTYCKWKSLLLGHFCSLSDRKFNQKNKLIWFGSTIFFYGRGYLPD